MADKKEAKSTREKAAEARAAAQASERRRERMIRIIGGIAVLAVVGWLGVAATGGGAEPHPRVPPRARGAGGPLEDHLARQRFRADLRDEEARVARVDPPADGLAGEDTAQGVRHPRPRCFGCPGEGADGDGHLVPPRGLGADQPGAS